MRCELHIDNEVIANFKNLDNPTRRKLFNEFSYFVPTARFTPAYKLGRWNGRVNFFEMGGKTYVGLLDQILPLIISAGYEVDVFDHRPDYNIQFDKIDKNYLSHIKWPAGHPCEHESVVLRDYQVDIVNAFMSDNQAIAQVSTGAGKTICTAALSIKVEEYGRSMVIVPSKTLVRQTAEDYALLGLDYGVYFGDEKVTNATHTICTWQSLESAYKKRDSSSDLHDIVEGVCAVIVDEAHSAAANKLKQLLTSTLAHVPIRWGLTGTIPKEDHHRQSLISGIGPILENQTVKSSDLQKKGVLSDLHIDIIQTKDISMPKFSAYKDEHNWLCTNKNRLDYIANKIDTISDSGNTLVLVDRIETGEYLVDNVDDAHFISGSMKVETRKEILDRMNNEDGITVVATYGTTSTGINVPRIFNLVLFEPGKSFVRVIQTIGRGIRKAKDKDFVQIYDICSTSKYSAKHLSERKSYYRENHFKFDDEKKDYS